MSRVMPYKPLAAGLDQQGRYKTRLTPTLEAAMNTDIEPWHMPHLERAAGFGLTEASLDRRQQEREADGMPLPELLLSKGSMVGPYKPCGRHRPVRRFIRALLAFVLAGKPDLSRKQ